MSDIVERMQEIFLTGTVSDCSASDCGDASLEVIKLRALCDSVQKERDQAVLDLEMAEDRIYSQ